MHHFFWDTLYNYLLYMIHHYHVHLGGEVAGDPSDPIGESNGERIDSEEVSGEEIA